MTVKFAISKSGHDKYQLYLVLKEEQDNVFLVNGSTKPIEHPKKKRKKHIQVIKKIPQHILDTLEESHSSQIYNNEGIRKALSAFENEG